MSLLELRQRVDGYAPPGDVGIVERAYAFAERAHGQQRRASGEPYMTHPLAVASILAELELDPVTLTAAMLHDVVEDTPVTLDAIREAFGDEVAFLVEGVTKLSRITVATQEEVQAESIRKMFLAMARDIRVILIKLADRLHNMRTIGALSPEAQVRNARETMELYAPLAHRLGIFRVKGELEDLALKVLEPERYRDLEVRVAQGQRARAAQMEETIRQLERALAEHHIVAQIKGREKNLYSIYRKMYVKGKDFDQIYDLVAVRVLVDSVRDCYGALGVVHALWRPLPGRFKDFIATPKPNLYQSLHSTVLGPGGDPVEIQIRTWEMHRTAEYGIAAHWKYKEGQTQGDDDKFGWLRQMLEWQRELKDPREFMESLKIDLYEDQVFVFTPKGKVIDLVRGSTPVDFAYRVHTDIGHHCVGAKVNGRLQPLDTPLRNGDIVEIITSKNSPGPSADWLSFVQSSGAKHRIRQWFKVRNRAENLERGREVLEREVKRAGLDPREAMRPELLDEVARRFHLSAGQDLLATLGYGGLSTIPVIARLRERVAPAPAETLPVGRRAEEFGKPVHGVQVRGVDNVLVQFARCCQPVPGDPIFGYVTRGRGVSVHRLDCPNAAKLLQEAERRVEVTWALPAAERGDELYPVELVVRAQDRPGLLADVAGALADQHTNILSATARTYPDHTALVNVMVKVTDLGRLTQIVSRLRTLPGIERVERSVRERDR